MNLRRYALYYVNKGLLDGDIESSIVFNLEEINQHKEGHNATIIFYIACQSFGSVCWTLEAIILQHTCLEECTLEEQKPVMDDAIFDDNDNSIVTNGVHTSGSNSQALAASLSQYASQLNRLSIHQKKESPLGAAI